jgi:hypothetical protein
MAADRDRVLKRVTEMLNLCAPGTYSATLSSRNKTRNATAIADFVDEAGLKICTAIADRPNEFRYNFLANSATITTSGDAMPAHLGPPAAVKITLYSGGTVRDGARRDYRKIQSYRELPNIYDPAGLAHNVAGSTLSGYYDIWDDRFFFTGFSAVLSLARLPVRADNLTLIPELMENTWIRLAMGEAAKVGTGGYESNIIASYGARGTQDLEEFKNGGRVFTEVDDPKPQSAIHNLSK